MKKFNPIEYNRQRWTDKNHTKNKPKQCIHGHNFCHIQYEWASQNNLSNSTINQNNNYPLGQEERTGISLDMMTQENLDDWMAQSINRSIPSMLNPQKKFFLPTEFQEELKARYRKKISSKQYEDEPYFKIQKKMKKAVSYIGSEPKVKLGGVESIDPNLLQTKTFIGTSIRIRQNAQKSTRFDKGKQSLDKSKQQMRKDVPFKLKLNAPRRNAVILDNDVHYNRFLKQLHRLKQTDDGQQVKVQKKLSTKQIVNKQMIYSFNIDSMKRTSCEEDVPNSIIEREFQRIKQPQKDFITANRNHLRKQEEIQEKAREAINEKAANAMSKIDNLAHNKKEGGHMNETGIFRKDSIVKKISYSIGRATIKQLAGTNKKIEQKVMKLLNNMQVISQHIDMEMSKLTVHLNQEILQNPTNQIHIKWMLKAQQKVKQKEHVLAIDCYKQSLILHPCNFMCVFNIAILLQKQKMLSYSKNWFQLAKEFGTDSDKVSYGLALVQVKQLQFANGLKQIDQLITRLQSKNHKVEMTFYYLRALCHKQLGMFQRSKIDYQIIIKHSKPSNYHSLSYFLLSVVFAKMRRFNPKFNCLSYMNWKQTLYLLFYEKNKKVRDQGMNNADLADKLIKQPFFCRFSKNLVKKLLSIAHYESIKKETILFISQNQSLILINGLVSIWSHQNNITQPDTVSVLGQGGVIGAGQIDHNLSARPNYWFLAKTELQILRVSRQQFKLFWQGQITFQWDYKYNFLKNVNLFKGLPQSTLFKLCEIVQLKKYQKGYILYNDCSYRYELLSKEGLGFCLGKNTTSDLRFVSSKKNSKIEQLYGNKKRVRSRLAALLKKHTFKFNQMKFNRLRYPGLFVLIQGKVEVEDDRGFRCKDIMSPRDYFGQNLLIHSQGFHNYGRMAVDSSSASFYLLSVQKMMWAFTSLDKDMMTENSKNRKEIDTLRFLRHRFSQCLQVKMAKLMSKKD